MSNIFENTDQQIGGAFTAENCTLSLGAGIDKAIVQRVQFSIERPINFVYEIANKENQPQNVYYVGGRRKGQATFERVVGGSGTFKAFVSNYGPLCQAAAAGAAAGANAIGASIKLTAKGGCSIGNGALNNGVGIEYTLKTPKITALGGTVSAQDIVIMETVTMVFLDLQYDEVNGANGGGAVAGGGGNGGGLILPNPNNPFNNVPAGAGGV